MARVEEEGDAEHQQWREQVHYVVHRHLETHAEGAHRRRCEGFLRSLRKKSPTFLFYGSQKQVGVTYITLGLIKDIGRRTNLFVPPALAHETTWATMSITSFLRSAISFQVIRKRIAVFLREALPDDFIPPPPHAASACGDVNDVAHGDLDSTPST